MASEQQHTFISATRYFQWFVIVTAAFITCLITADGGVSTWLERSPL